MLGKAFEHGWLKISEISERGSVPELKLPDGCFQYGHVLNLALGTEKRLTEMGLVQVILTKITFA